MMMDANVPLQKKSVLFVVLPAKFVGLLIQLHL